MRSATASQWIATIYAAKDIRAEEIQRSGLLKFLLDYKDTLKVTKVQLLEVAEYAISKCRITVQTERATLYRPALLLTSLPRELIPQKVLDTFENNEVISCHKLASFDYKVVRLKFTGMFGSGESWFVFDEHWRQFKPNKSYGKAVEAIDFLYTVAANKFNKYSSRVPHNRYERFALLGKRKSYKEWIVSIPSWDAYFDRSHFNVENTIIHLRTSEWKDNEDEPLLLIDEIQSDWHAMGRCNGYWDVDDPLDKDETDAVPDAPYIKEWHELGVKIAIWIAIQSGHDRVAFTTGSIHGSRYGNNLESFHLLYDHLIPKSLQKIAKKFECLVNTSTIITCRPNHSLHNRGALGWELLPSVKDEVSTTVRNEEVAMRYMQSRGQKKPEAVHVLEVSSKLQYVVKSKGLPLFGWW